MTHISIPGCAWVRKNIYCVPSIDNLHELLDALSSLAPRDFSISHGKLGKTLFLWFTPGGSALHQRQIAIELDMSILYHLAEYALIDECSQRLWPTAPRLSLKDLKRLK